MDAIHLHEGHRKIGRRFRPLHPRIAAPKARSSKQIDSLGELYAHALAMEKEAAARYREFATLMADCGNDNAAELFRCLAQFGVEHAFHLAKKSVGIEIPIVNADQHACFDNGTFAPEARAFIFRMMTPRLALEIALRAERQAKAYFKRVLAESRNVGVRMLAAELARDEQSHIDWVADALARLPRPFRADEDQLGDPTIEQQL